MSHETDALNVVIYACLGLAITALGFIIWHMYTRILVTQDAFIEALNEIKLEQVEQNLKIENNHDHIKRIERIQLTQAESLADTIVAKLRAASGSH